MTASRIPGFDLSKTPLEGTNLIEAGAGTGKTYAIAGIFLRLLLEQRLTSGQILVVTYTVAATEELRTRIRAMIGGAVRAFESGGSDDPFLDGLVKSRPQKQEALRLLKAALRDFDEAPIFTIHGFCQRTLHENAFESMSLFDTELITDEAKLREEIVQDFWRLHFYSAPPEFAAHAIDQGCGPEFYLKLSRRAAADPDVRIVPDAQPVRLLSLEPFREEAVKVKAAWPDARSEVVRKLKDPALHKSKYRNGGAALIAAMDLYASAKSAWPLFERFDRMTPKGLKEGTNRNQVTPGHPFFELCATLLSLAERLQEEIEAQLLFLKCEIFRYMRRELPARKRQLNIQSFDDLLISLRRALESGSGQALAGTLRKRYRAALVDEFQDTDPVQYSIFQSVFEKGDSVLFLIGDPKQAIYSFRGADLFAYLRASKSVTSRYTLASNWRSEPGLIQAVNAVFSGPAHPFVCEDIVFEPAVPGEKPGREFLTLSGKAEPPLQLWYVPAEKLDEASALTRRKAARNLISAATASAIADLLLAGRERRALIGSRPLEENDVAVLVRTNDEAHLMQKELRELGVASVLHSMDNLFDTGEALEMERLLAGISEPGSEGPVRTALATAVMGVNGEEIEKLARDEKAWEERLSCFRNYYDLWERHGFIRMFRSLLQKEGVRVRLLAFPDGERRLTNILHLSEVLHRASVENRLGMAGLVKWLARQRGDESPRLEEHQLRLESDARAVRIVTIHKSKGLEYPVVFCPFNWGGSAVREGEFLFHDEQDGWRANLVLHSPDPGKRLAAEKESLAENVRLLYVSLTRAKHRCHLAWGPFKDAGTSSLSWILHPQRNVCGNVLEDMERRFTERSEGGGDMRPDLEDLVRRSGGTIRLSGMPEGKRPGSIKAVEETREFSSRVFTGTVQKDWKVSSFSHLTSARAEELTAPTAASGDLPDHDAGTAEVEAASADEPTGIFAFPRGARAGTLLHSIFENLDFTGSGGDIEILVSGILREFGFDPKWLETLSCMIRRVLSVPFPSEGDGLSLSQIAKKEKVSELEFYFPLKRITPEKLKGVFAKHRHGIRPSEFPGRIEELRFEPCRGFMKGFMDLLFRWDGRFHLVDWKSNFLGSRVEDYAPGMLERAMMDHHYVLQYHLYTVALDRYLATRVPGYDYGQHFGGVFYIFLRGVDPARGRQYGIYHDVPSRELIEALKEELLEM